MITMSFAALAVFLSTIVAGIASKGKHRRAMPAWLSQVILPYCSACLVKFSVGNTRINYFSSFFPKKAGLNYNQWKHFALNV